MEMVNDRIMERTAELWHDQRSYCHSCQWCTRAQGVMVCLMQGWQDLSCKWNNLSTVFEITAYCNYNSCNIPSELVVTLRAEDLRHVHSRRLANLGATASF